MEQVSGQQVQRREGRGHAQLDKAVVPLLQVVQQVYEGHVAPRALVPQRPVRAAARRRPAGVARVGRGQRSHLVRSRDRG